MSFSRRRIIKAASYFIAGAAAMSAKKVIQIANAAEGDVAIVPSSYQTKWAEKILNSDGTINWTEYTNVAKNYDRSDIINYRLGPDYSFYYPDSEDIPELWGPDSDGFMGNCSNIKAGSVEGATDWYAMSGQLVFSPDADAPEEYKPGVARARNGSIYLYDGDPKYCFDMRVQWTPDRGNYYSANPDGAVTQESWKNISGGSVPAPPIATVRAKGSSGVTGYLIFQNGLIGATGTGNDGYVGSGSSLPYPCLKLPSGKVPTAAAVTPGNEFLLVTVWDTINRQGQLAVIAIKGRVLAQEKTYLWGFPNWPTIEKMKILGYINLPFASPSAIACSLEFATNSGRGRNENANLDLNSQEQRDTWYNWTSHDYKKTARCGYAVVISRAQNKASFIDLQPLLEYYRKMYLTTQENYNQTKNEGNSSKQWPYTFSYAPEQKPKVVSTVTVKNPTAVATGLPWFTFFWRDGDNSFRENAYIATMDGELRMYKVGNLMTTNSGGTIGQPFKTVKIGKNPTNIDYGTGANYGNDMFINCRGEKTIYYLYYDGRIHGSFRDARLQDPVYVAVSYNGRSEYNCPLLTVTDFKGKQVVNYRYQNDGPEAINTPVGNPGGSSVFEYGSATPLPGYPFMSTYAEVI